MSFTRMLDRDYALRENVEVRDDYGTLLRTESRIIERGRCAVKRNTMTGAQGSPALGLERSMRVYLPAASQVRAGHVIEVAGLGSLKVAQPYWVCKHHYEVEGDWSDEA
ncbi:MAG TPA: hypothetical protein PKE04_05390 [Clostridia bacterium]|nr:hypothetical protein [Clostridia bacterium]